MCSWQKNTLLFRADLGVSGVFPQMLCWTVSEDWLVLPTHLYIFKKTAEEAGDLFLALILFLTHLEVLASTVISVVWFSNGKVRITR